MPSLFSPAPPGNYEYTGIITFHFSDSSAPSSLSDNTTTVGQVWAATLRSYLELEKTGVVWWALVHEAPQKAKLFIDWKTAEAREQFEASDESKALWSAWGSVTATPATSAVYRWPHDEVARKTALSSTHETISVLFTFKFPKPLGSGAPEWDASFGEFSNAVMKSSGGVVATSCSSGWELNKSSFCGAFRYLSQDAMKLFLEGGEGKRLFETLQSLATAGVEVEYLETRQFDQGWQGSVDKTRPDNPVATAMFSDLQSKLGGDGFAALRRV